MWHLKGKIMESIIYDDKLSKIEEIYEGKIKNINDLIAGEDPEIMFYFLIKCFGYLLDNDPEKVVSKQGILIRKKINFLIKSLGPSFLKNPQIFENREELMKGKTFNKTSEIFLPQEPVIWVSNHAFKDDTLASILAAKRHAYILFGSLPQFFNTIDGITSWINGVVMTNRKLKDSKQASIPKALRVIDYQTDLMAFVEGVWNKTPEKPLLDIFDGVYRIAKERGCKIVPIVHYMRDNGIIYKNPYEKNNPNFIYDKSLDPIHTIVDEPIRIDDLSQKAALEYIREILSTWFWLMAEKYGESTRENEVQFFHDSKAAWDFRLNERISTVDKYDKEIELSADYRSKESFYNVWNDIANIQNINDVTKDSIKYAKKILESDYQRRF